MHCNYRIVRSPEKTVLAHPLGRQDLAVLDIPVVFHQSEGVPATVSLVLDHMTSALTCEQTTGRLIIQKSVGASVTIPEESCLIRSDVLDDDGLGSYVVRKDYGLVIG